MCFINGPEPRARARPGLPDRVLERLHAELNMCEITVTVHLAGTNDPTMVRKIVEGGERMRGFVQTLNSGYT